MRVELTNPTHVVDVIKDPNVHVLWAPGDATLYRVALLNTVNYGVFDTLSSENDFVVLLVVLSDDVRGLMMSRPRGKDELWTVQRFLTCFGREHAGWWAGVRPLLAALNWTTPEHASLNYDPSDAVEIGQLLEVSEGSA